MATGLVKLIRFADIPAKGNPTGLTQLLLLSPTGDRGLTFGRSLEGGVPLGKIPGYWTCPYNGIISAVFLNTDRGGYTIRVWKSLTARSPIADDRINTYGYSIYGPLTHMEHYDMSDFTMLDVIPGDTFAVEVTWVSSPPPTDIAGNVVILKTEEEK
jgi:hypothetical protein